MFPPERGLEISTAQWTVQALGRLALTFGVLVGALILIGGEERFGGRSYAAALTYPGAPESWGYVALLVGLAGLVCSTTAMYRYVWWSLLVLAIWAGFFAISFAETAIEDPQSSTTGVAVYGYVAVSSLVLGVAHRRSARG